MLSAMKLSIKPALQKRLLLTFSMRQALHMLQMPQHELAQWLLSEIEKNPLLELDIPSSSAPYRKDIAELEAPPTLHNLLLNQIEESFPNPKDKMLALSLLEHLDERGYLFPCPKDIPLDPVLPILQSFHPPGIFARDLRECLLLQIQPDSPAYQIVNLCFHELLHGKFETIKKKTGISDLTTAIQMLSRLTLRPADLFKKEHAQLAIADLSISKVEETWIVEAIEDELPKIHFRTDYLSLVCNSSKEMRSLRSWSASGKWLLRSLKRRKLLLLEIGAFLARKQAAYLDQKGPLRPLILEELAQHLHVHASTLSRALSGKYAQTPRGLLPLNSLLSTDPQAEHAKQLLRQLIAKEDKTRPLTDAIITKQLQESGLTLARRTVAKYRKNLRIGSASLRKHTH